MALANKPTSVPDGIHKPAYEVAATKIVEFITASNLKPGERLPTERALGEQLGVSRTVVREAIKLLTATGIVRTHQGSGLYVHNEPRPFATAAINLSMSVDPQDVQSLFEFRITLETKTAYLAAERITPREIQVLQETVELNRKNAEAGHTEQFHASDEAFHRGIAEATRNPFFASAVTTATGLLEWVTIVVTGGTPGSLLVAAEQHADILRAIQSGQSDEAANTMQLHIETTMANYQQAVRKRLMSDGQIPSE